MAQAAVSAVREIAVAADVSMTTVAVSVGVSIAIVDLVVLAVIIYFCKKKQRFCFKPKTPSAPASPDGIEQTQ